MNPETGSFVASSQARQRGKKREPGEIFIQKCQAIVDKAQHQLDLGELHGIELAEKKRLRNVISANKNRILRKKEPIYLLNSMKQKDSNFEEVLG